MSNFTPQQLRFPPIAGRIVRGAFAGGALSSDFGALMRRGDGHFANPELMALSVDDPHTDFVFALTGNAVLTRLAEAPLAATRALHARRCADAKRSASRTPARTRTYYELDYAARSWTPPARVILKAEVTAFGDNPRYVALRRHLRAARRRAASPPEP